MDIPWQTRTDRRYKPDLDAWVISRRFPLINNADFAEQKLCENLYLLPGHTAPQQIF